ncbi:MAG: oxygen-dependent protoporphyrinogen oxidase [Myxococcota bacterium]|jgi:oxygen-dependent protoporphyrinogen oxidase
MSDTAEVVVIGAGFAGLAAAHRLERRGVDVRVFDAAEDVGGVIRSVRADSGFLFESAAESLRGESPCLQAWIEQTGLSDAIIPAQARAKKRFLLHQGRLEALPMSPPGLVKSPLLSRSAKFRLLREPFVRRSSYDPTASLGQILRTRLGAEVVDRLVDAVVTGVFAGSVDQLGIDAFPTIRGLLETDGSLLRGMLRRRGQGRGRGGIYTLRDGLGMLAQRTRATLGDRLSLGSSVVAVDTDADGVVVRLHHAAPVRAKHAIIATPAHAVAALVDPTDPVLRWLTSLDHPHVAKVGLGFRRADIAHALDGFGALVPRDERLPADVGPVIGVIFSSSVFAGRAPDDHVTVTFILGGVRNRASVELDDAALVGHAAAAARYLLGASGEPVASHVARWSQAIPQYEPGHAAGVQAIQQALPSRILLAGNYLGGVSVEAAVASGFRAADQAMTRNG